jgi:hypothetical protein
MGLGFPATYKKFGFPADPPVTGAFTSITLGNFHATFNGHMSILALSPFMVRQDGKAEYLRMRITHPSICLI